MDDLSTGSDSDYSNSCVRPVAWTRCLTCNASLACPLTPSHIILPLACLLFSWITWFLSTKGNEYFAEVDEDYILDRFNLTGLNSEVVNEYPRALELITDSLGESFQSSPLSSGLYITDAIQPSASGRHWRTSLAVLSKQANDALLVDVPHRSSAWFPSLSWSTRPRIAKPRKGWGWAAAPEVRRLLGPPRVATRSPVA